VPRPKPDQIIRHQIVFGEADRKILDRAIDSYTFSNFTKNAVTLMNDVTGMVTFLTLIGATGILGASFIFKVSESSIAKGAVDLVIDEFRQQTTEALEKKGIEKEELRNLRVDRGVANIVDDILNQIYAGTAGIAPQIFNLGRD
jgi:hypothetical protein